MIYVVIFAALLLWSFAANLLLHMSFWTVLFWSCVTFAFFDFICWASPKVWAWAKKPTPSIADQWREAAGLPGLDAKQGVANPESAALWQSPLILGADLSLSRDETIAAVMKPGAIVTARDLGLPADATVGEIAYAADRALKRHVQPPAPKARHALRGANGKFVKRPA